jgi:type II secretory pathway pseudopilin PulG
MDNTLLIAIVALILGLIFGWLLARVTGRGAVNELESRLRQAQSAADGAKRDATNLQSELNIKQTHINTLNSNIGILEEKLRLAEAGGQAEMATIARLQSELKTAQVDKPAFEAELHDRDAELNRVRAQLEAQREEAIDLWRQVQAAEAATAEARSQLDAIEAENARREAARLAALFETAQAASLQDSLTPAQEAPGAAAGEGDKVMATLTSAADPDELEATRKEIFDLKDGIATLAFAGAELAGAYEKRNKEYDELLAQVRSGSSSNRTLVIEKQAPAQEGLGPAAKMGLVAGGVALAGAASEGEKEKETAEAKAGADAGPSAEELNAQIEALKGQYAALQADLQTEAKSKADLAGELQARLADLSGLKETLATADGNLDELIGPVIKPEGEAGSAEGAGPVGVVAKLAVVKTLVDGLKSSKADLEGKLQTKEAEFSDVSSKLAALTTDIDALVGPAPEGVELPADPQAKLGLVKTNLDGLTAAKVELEAKLGATSAELDGLRGTIAEVTADVNDLLGLTPEAADQAKAALTAAADGAQVELPADLKSKLGLVKGNITALTSHNSEMESKLHAEGIELGVLRKQMRSLDGLLSDVLDAQSKLEQAATAAQPAAVNAVTGG